MKPKFSLFAATVAATFLAWPAYAEHENNGRQDQTGIHGGQHKGAWNNQNMMGKSAKATQLIGMDVRTPQNERLGKVADLAVDLETGHVVQVILSTGGVLGVGSKHVAVPPASFHHDTENHVLHLDTTKEKLKGSTDFDMSNWSDSSQEGRMSESYRTFGQRPYFGGGAQYFDNATTPGASSSPAISGSSSSSGVNAPRSVNNNTPSTSDSTYTGQRPSTLGQGGSTAATSGQSQTREETRGHNNNPWHQNRLGYVERASKVIGMPVRNMQDEKIGRVENLIVDLQAGRVSQVIVSSGGFIGIGDELNAVPPTSFKFTGQHDALQLDATKETLSSAPHFRSSQWPDFDNQSYVSGIYQAYRVDPWYSSGSVNGAGTGQVGQDRNGASSIGASDSRSGGAQNLDANGRAGADDTTRKNRDSSISSGSSDSDSSGNRSANDRNANFPRDPASRARNPQDKDPSTQNNAGSINRSQNSDSTTSGTSSSANRSDDSSSTRNTDSSLNQNGDSNKFFPRDAAGRARNPQDRNPATQNNNPEGSLNRSDNDSASSTSTSTSTDATTTRDTDSSRTTSTTRDSDATRAGNGNKDDQTNRNADNSARNRQDRDNASVTPTDQSSTTTDVDLTRQVRRQVVARKDLSVNAHNVKIITSGNKVTLRGPVDSEEEKRQIAEIATRVAGSADKVDNQIEVKNP